MVAQVSLDGLSLKGSGVPDKAADKKRECTRKPHVPSPAAPPPPPTTTPCHPLAVAMRRSAPLLPFLAPRPIASLASYPHPICSTPAPGLLQPPTVPPSLAQ